MYTPQHQGCRCKHIGMPGKERREKGKMEGGREGGKERGRERRKEGEREGEQGRRKGGGREKEGEKEGGRDGYEAAQRRIGMQISWNKMMAVRRVGPWSLWRLEAMDSSPSPASPRLNLFVLENSGRRP